jgi:hypothetical protein
MLPRVHSEQNGLHIWNEEPMWFHETRLCYCQTDGCWRFLDLPCRTCKFERQPYARPLTGMSPFVTVILCLIRKGVPRALATWMVKNYIVVSTMIFLTCPYVKIGNKTFHQHCVTLGKNKGKTFRQHRKKRPRLGHEYANAEMALFHHKHFIA